MKYSLPRWLLLSRSNLPISRNRPPWARQRTEAWSFSSAREFRTRSTPLPFVSDKMSCSKEVSREFPMLRSVNWNRWEQTNILAVHLILSSSPLLYNVSELLLRKVVRWEQCSFVSMPSYMTTISLMCYKYCNIFIFLRCRHHIAFLLNQDNYMFQTTQLQE